MAILINQVSYDHFGLKIDLGQGGVSFGLLDGGCAEINYSHSIEDEVMLGGNRLPVDETEGHAAFDGSITLERYWFNFLVARAKALGMGLAQLRLVLGLTYQKEPAAPVTDTLIGVRLLGADNSSSKGPDKHVVEMSMRPRNIYYDGIDVFGNRL
jgi:hypothetical protein